MKRESKRKTRPLGLSGAFARSARWRCPRARTRGAPPKRTSPLGCTAEHPARRSRAALGNVAERRPQTGGCAAVVVPLGVSSWPLGGDSRRGVGRQRWRVETPSRRPGLHPARRTNPKRRPGPLSSDVSLAPVGNLAYPTVFPTETATAPGTTAQPTSSGGHRDDRRRSVTAVDASESPAELPVSNSSRAGGSGSRGGKVAASVPIAPEGRLAAGEGDRGERGADRVLRPTRSRRGGEVGRDDPRPRARGRAGARRLGRSVRVGQGFLGDSSRTGFAPAFARKCIRRFARAPRRRGRSVGAEPCLLPCRSSSRSGLPQTRAWSC